MASSRSRKPGFRLDTLARQARQPLFVLDPRGRLVHANAAWEALTGLSLDQVRGRTCWQGTEASSSSSSPRLAAFQPPAEALAGQWCCAHSQLDPADTESAGMLLEFQPIHRGDGALVAVLGWVRDEVATPSVPISPSAEALADLIKTRARLIQQIGWDQPVGQGVRHRRLIAQIDLAARSDCPLLIVGEPGTGGRIVAHAIHRRREPSPGSRPLLVFDIDAVPPEWLQRELFSFSAGASQQSSVPADATVVLDDILKLPRDLQTPLVQSLEGPRRFRLIGVTSGDLDEARRGETLRPELAESLSTLVIRLAPLRERLDELALLARDSIERINQRSERRRDGLTAEALAILERYDWPGNLDELDRVLNHAHDRSGAPWITAADLPSSIQGHLGAAYLVPGSALPPIPPLERVLEEVERELIEQAMRRAHNNKSRAADLLGISRPRLYRRMNELGLIPDESGSGAVPEPSSRSEPTVGEAPGVSGSSEHDSEHEVMTS